MGIRSITFRGKRADNGEWVEGDLLHVNNRILILAHGCAFECNPETVGQYTGLTDKNGKHIFEGDIIFCKKHIDGNFVDASIEFGFVEMKYGAFGLHRKQGFYRPFKDWLEDYELEVIGDIHDNPELLK